MAEASIEWKVDTLRAIMSAPLHARYAPRPDTEEMAWFLDMKNDGYVDGKWGREVDMANLQLNSFPMIPTGGREVFSELHVTEKGKKLVRDYDVHQQSEKDLKKFDALDLLKWDDKTLADWQSRYNSNQAQWILADQEWKRRAGVSTRKIAIAAIVVSVLSLLVAALTCFRSIYPAVFTPAKLPDKSAEQSQLPMQPTNDFGRINLETNSIAPSIQSQQH